ncbi:MAG: hypothetical protein OXU45_00915 [Candidatus Melainabacteria bacterium]|nr:hypothetical protein [Candidatus Melainabacteria bacterium]
MTSLSIKPDDILSPAAKVRRALTSLWADEETSAAKALTRTELSQQARAQTLKPSTAIIQMVRKSDLAGIQGLVDKFGPSMLLVKDRIGSNLLELAASHTQFFTDLIKLVADHELIDHFQTDPNYFYNPYPFLHNLINKKHYKAARIAIEHGIDPNIPNKDLRSPLKMLYVHGRQNEDAEKLVQAIYQTGPDLDEKFFGIPLGELLDEPWRAADHGRWLIHAINELRPDGMKHDVIPFPGKQVRA